MNMRALKKEWKMYRKDCKRNNVEFLPLDEFVEKVLSEQNDTAEDSANFGEHSGELNTDSSTSNNNEDGISNDDFVDIPDIVPVKLITRCTCREVCPCHEIDETCSCEEECDCVKETVNQNMPEKKGPQLTFEQSENYEEYLESLPSDVKYSELEPDLWNTIIHTDTFKKAECYDIKTAERNTQEVLATYKELFKKKIKKTSTKKKSKKSSKKSKSSKKTTSVKVVDVAVKEESSKPKTTKKPAAKKSIATKSKTVSKPAKKAASKSSSKKKTTKK